MEVDTLVNVITIILAVGNFICLYSISRKKAYNEEKGKNLATKEDIEEITKKIESTKVEYLKELEQYKYELIDEREKIADYKESSIDKKLIKLLEKANSVICDDGIIHNNNVENVNSALEELCSYILKYEFIYKKNKSLYIILEQFNRYVVSFNSDKANLGYLSNKSNEIIRSIHCQIKQALKSFINKQS